MSIDQCLHSALRRVEGRRRRDVPGIRPLLPDARRRFPRRVPDRAAARRRRTARLPGLHRDLRHDRQGIPDLRLQGQTGARPDPLARCRPLFLEFYKAPRCGEVYNLGGGRQNSVSILETIDILADMGYQLKHTYKDANRTGDHICYISDLTKIHSISRTGSSSTTCRGSFRKLWLHGARICPGPSS